MVGRLLVVNDEPNTGRALQGALASEGFDVILATDDAEALVGDGMPYASFAVEDVQREFARLRELGVRFMQELMAMGLVTIAVLDDTCGNLIQIA